MPWMTYILLSEKDGSTYVGVTIDVERRLRQHNGEAPGGARRTRAGRPWKLHAIHGPFEGRGSAQQVEHQIKRLGGRARLVFTIAEAP